MSAWLFALAVPSLALADLTGRVVTVGDGDTATVLVAKTIRKKTGS